MKNLLIVFLLFLSPLIQAQTYVNKDVESLLSASEPPSGVVFEVITSAEDAWTWIAPMLKQYRQQLLNQYPDIDIAVVSHGGEQFQLVKDNKQNILPAVDTLQALSDEGVDLHVCGTHSSWRDVDDSAYLDFIDVSPSGPAQINDYIKLGYTHVMIRAPK